MGPLGSSVTADLNLRQLVSLVLGLFLKGILLRRLVASATLLDPGARQMVSTPIHLDASHLLCLNRLPYQTTVLHHRCLRRDLC